MSLIRKGPVPAQEQRDIVEAYHDGHGDDSMRDVAKAFGRSPSTVNEIIQRARTHDGDPVTPRGHRKRKLTESDDEALAEALDDYPYATNKQLANEAGVAAETWDVSRALRRAKPGFSKKQVVEQDPREETDEWKNTMNTFEKQTLRPIKIAKRIYEDETAIWTNERLSQGRTRKGKQLRRTKVRNPKKYVLHLYAKRDHVVHWELRDVDAQNDDFLSIVKRAARKFDEGDTLIWDQLGKYGNEKNPYRLHWDPEAKEAIEDEGASMVMLPPSGYYFMPLDLLFNDLKQHYIRPEYAKNGDPMSKSKMQSIIKKYMEEVAPNTLPGFFRSRANGRDAKKAKLY